MNNTTEEKREAIPNSVSRMLLAGIGVLLQVLWIFWLALKLNDYSTVIQVCTSVLAFLITLGKKIQMSSFILNAICAFGVAVTAACVNRVTSGWNLDIVIISSLMPLVPGVAITNAIRDTLRGDYISGGARILEAFLTAAAIGLGAGTGMIFVGGIV